MKRSTRSAAGSGVEKSTKLRLPAGHRADPLAEQDARPLAHVVAVAGEVDPGDAADAPLRVAEAARVAVHDRVVGHAAAERVVARALAAAARARCSAS